MTAPARPDRLADDPADDPADDVVLLDDEGRPTGSAPRLEVHTTDTPLHLAFSVHLLDPDGRTLLTRRALGKQAWPGVWTNSCCGHPRPGEPVADAVRRRTREELGLALGDVDVVLPDFRYRAVDASGVVEHEVCPVHVARVERDPVLDPHPGEVAEHAWVPWADVHGAVTRTPAVFSPWLVLQARALGPDLTAHTTTAHTRSRA
ncbi:isopentenyl-diphosphate Delta-isomerase [Nocardioides kribbensis]|uniref:isopentenyl-diphosphate Delta-isomerase n=1 Tax=Nocardioides kribbensis TaxID=305517 RepID=UPI0032DBA89B